MTIEFELTKRQAKLLEKQFRAIRVASLCGQRGVFLAQIQKNDWDKRAIVTAHFFPGKLSTPIIEVVGEARLPYGYAGIPPVSIKSVQSDG